MTSGPARRGAVFMVLTMAASLGIAGLASTAGANAGAGVVVGGELAVGIEVGQPAHPVAIDADPSSLPRLVHYKSTRLAGGRTGDLENVCNATVAVGNDPALVVFGWLYDVIAYTNDDRVISDTHECVPFPDPNDHSVGPSLLPFEPTAPTIGDVWRAVGLSRPSVGVNPVTRGVTGLTTQLWSGGAQTAQIAVTIGQWRVTGTARVVEYRFSTDEGYVGASVVPGDASDPAAVHDFAVKGAHALSVASVWRATAIMTGPNSTAPVPINIDTAVLTVTVAYPVVEVRTRIVA